MKYKLMRLVMALMMILSTSAMMAQGIAVSDFRLLENDLTANLHGTMQKDYNGEVAALIKVETTEQGFVFDGGMVGIVKTIQKTGEIWVYVPHGIKKITIQHQQLGTLRDYYFPIVIEKAKTYQMKLTTGSVKTVTNVSVNQQFVMFQVTPANASVEINNEALLVDEHGMASKRLPYGTYQYRVSCTDYHTQAGVVEVKADGKAMVNVSLKPNFGWIDISGDTEFHGAYVYLNNERVGQVPMKTEALKSNSYHLRFIKPMYKNYEQDVLVKDNETTHIQLQMQANFAQVTLQAADETEIWVEGEHKGKGVLTLKLEPGQYKVETKRASHQSNSQLLQINNLTAMNVVLEEPAPLYGSLEVNTSPMMAKVYLDGKEVGETPFFMNNILIGAHELRVEKEGYAAQQQSITIEHGAVSSQNLTLSSQLRVRFDANGGSGSMSDQIFNAGATFLLLNANAFTHSGHSFAGWNTSPDGSGHSYNRFLKPEQDVTLYAQWKKGNFENGHEWVDLGLPSGIKWATCNIGATSPEDYGSYFAWGELTPKYINKTYYIYYQDAQGNIDIVDEKSSSLYEKQHPDNYIRVSYSKGDVGLPIKNKQRFLEKYPDAQYTQFDKDGRVIGGIYINENIKYKYYFTDNDTNNPITGSPRECISKYFTNKYAGYNYIADNKTTLELSDDAARVNWGGTWRMPTKAEQDELRNNCTWTWVTQNGINGYKVTSKTNGNSIFLPAAGGEKRGEYSIEYVGLYGFYWSSSLVEMSNSNAVILWFHSEAVDYNRHSRDRGCTVRAVCP